jgi:hypothetical protein
MGLFGNSPKWVRSGENHDFKALRRFFGKKERLGMGSFGQFFCLCASVRVEIRAVLKAGSIIQSGRILMFESIACVWVLSRSGEFFFKVDGYEFLRWSVVRNRHYG